eukprot:TRINITY_DN4438_c0_g3_i1.p1 TRINITY_DN4438_c0_g3~~TRINITY_DN4438_c0_g3_i1.p1  ORF type:complete len:284 (+),score=35.56 TRINITY_DN4438_c0_g3_i1:1-852(+)
MLNPNSSVKGVRLDNYIPLEADKTRLHQQLTSSTLSKESSVRCLNVTIRDSDGNNMKVELFSVAFETLNRSTHYMLGIREFSDLAPLRRTVRLNLQDEAFETSSRQSENSESNQRSEDAASSRDGALDATLPTSGPPREVVGRPVLDSDPGGLMTGDVQDIANGNGEVDAYNAADDAAASAPLDANAAAALQMQESRNTSEEAKLATLVALIKSWKIKSSRNWCCEMHMAVPEVQRLLKIVRKSDCMVLREDCDEQCSDCGLIQGNSADSTCRICRHVRRVHL